MTSTTTSPRRGLTLADYAVVPLKHDLGLLRRGASRMLLVSEFCASDGDDIMLPIPDLIAAACDDALHSPDHHAEDLTLRLDKSDLRLIFDGLQMLADTCRDEADRLGAYDESGEADDYLADADEARQLAELIARSTQAVLTPIDEASETRGAA